jgi:hypothetical protein
VQRPPRLFDHNTESPNTKNGPEPPVTELLHTRPEGVLVVLELLELGEFFGMGCRVSALLMLLLLGISTEEA